MLPLIGRTVATQREIEVRLHPECEWSIKGFIDLETVRDRPVDVTDKGLVIAAGEKAPRGCGHRITPTMSTVPVLWSLERITSSCRPSGTKPRLTTTVPPATRRTGAKTQ
jgi:hypothetical protein